MIKKMIRKMTRRKIRVEIKELEVNQWRTCQRIQHQTMILTQMIKIKK